MLFVKKLNPAAKLPTVANPGEDLGYDLYALEDRLLVPGVPTLVPTGIAARFTMSFGPNPGPNYGLLIRDRSSMARKGIMVSAGVIDAGYTGEIGVNLTNTNRPTYDLELPKIMLSHEVTQLKLEPRRDAGYYVKAGDKIAQMIPLVVYTNTGIEQVEYLPESTRGSNGYGSTGR